MKLTHILPFLCLGIISLLITSCNDSSKPASLEVNPAFSEYVLGFNSGFVNRKGELTIKLSEKSNAFTELDGQIEKNLFSFSPDLLGTSHWKDAQTIVFKPSEPLKFDQTYKIKFKLGDVLDVDSEFQTFSYSVKTRSLDLAVNTDGFKPYDEKNLTWNSFTGTVVSSDFVENESIEKLLDVEFAAQKMPLKWTHSVNGRTHYFTADSIERKATEAGEILVLWDGGKLKSGMEGSITEELPALSDFKFMSAKVVQQPEQHVKILFSDPINREQPLKGLIRLAGVDSDNLRLEVKGNKILAYPNDRQKGELMLAVSSGIENSLGFELKASKDIELAFLEVKPAIKMNTAGVILPSTDGLILPFQAVNLDAVDVTVTKIYENNIHQFLQTNSTKGTNQLTRVGKKVLKKKVNLIADNTTDYGMWNNFSLDLEELISEDPGAIYRVNIDFKKSYSLYPCEGTDKEEEEEEALKDSWSSTENYDEWTYDDYYYEDYYYDEYYYEDYNYSERDNPCHSTYYRQNRGVTKSILASNIGLISKLGKDRKLFVSANDIRSTAPMASVKLQVFDYQNQLVAEGSTASDGTTNITLPEKPFLLVATKGNEKGYLKLNDGSALTTSHFDVSGAVVQQGIKGLIYGERGVWRPGDTLFLSFILEDKLQNLPENHPVKFELTNPKSQLVERIVRPKSEHGFYTFKVVTDEDAPTGYWSAKVKVGSATFSKSIRVETVKPNRLKLKFDFEDELLKAKRSSGNLEVKWLHGAVAKNLKAKIDVKLVKSYKGFDGYDEYQFSDPVKQFYSSEQTILDGRINDQGKVSFPVDVQMDNVAPGLLTAKFSARVFEEAGDFSVDRFSMPYSPYTSYVGIKGFSENARDVLLTDSTHHTEIVTLDDSGKPIDVRDLQVDVYKMNWRWWWDASSSNSGSYLSTSSRDYIDSYKVSTKNGKAQVKVSVKYPDWGRYFVRVTNPESGHSTGTIVYIDWPGWATRTDRGGVGASVLTFQTDKSTYNVGENVSLTIPSSGEGRALITVENGSRIISSTWAESLGTEMKHNFKVTPDMAPNAFVSVTMVQPHKHKNSLPIRMYGVVPISVKDPNTILNPEIITADELAPETTAEVKVKEANGNPMTYTLAIVDEGLLDLTRFKTPQPHKVFYAREALGVKTWDLYDDVIGAYGGELERILSIGGDGEAKGDSDKSKINRFKPMVRYLGPFKLEAGKTAVHKIDIPNYIGSVRTMVIAGKDGAYGHAEKATPVKKPLMVLATLPRVLGPLETVKLPVTVFAMDQKIKNVQVKIKANGMFKSDYNSTANMSFSEMGDQVMNFELRTIDKIGKGTVTVEVSSGGETAKYDIELAVRNPNPPMTKYLEKAIAPGESWESGYELVGVEGTNAATLEFSNLPPIDLERRLRYLIGYPHGCAEQTTSRVFAQLYVGDVMEEPPHMKNRISEYVMAALTRLRSMQTANGGFNMWPGYSRSNDWVSTYVGHFMIEAEKKGFTLPAQMKQNWLSYQRSTAQSHTEGRVYNNHLYSYYDQAQAYRLYTLAVAGKPELGAMNRLKTNGKLSDTALWLLAAAYHLAGQADIAASITSGLSTNISTSTRAYYSYSYGSSSRNEAIMLMAMNDMGMTTEGFKVLDKVSNSLSNNRWISTQTTAFSLLAATQFIAKNKVISTEMSYSYSLNRSDKGSITTGLPFKQVQFSESDLALQRGNVTINNTGTGVMYARLVLSGTPAKGIETDDANNLSVDVWYTDVDGNAIDVSKMNQGTDFVANVRVTNPDTEHAVNDVALTQIFPSGWEIYNSRMDEALTLEGTDTPEYQDFRDDRVYTYFSLGRRYRNSSNHTKLFKIRLNSSYLGTYYLPAIKAEAMYNGEIYAVKKGREVSVVQGGE
ncbi:MAG: alpha-2-macroglobulin [Flavobacteriales bacterium]